MVTRLYCNTMELRGIKVLHFHEALGYQHSGGNVFA
jgi:hypothetical protein